MGTFSMESYLKGQVEIGTLAADEVLTYDGSKWANAAGGAGGGGWTIVGKTSDETINNDSTLSDDSELKFSVDANSEYTFFQFFYYVSHATPDLKHAFAGPAGSTMSKAATGTFLTPNSGYTTTNGTTVIVCSPSGADERFSVNYGYITTGGTAGELAFQWAQNTSNANNTTIKKNSWIMYKKVA